MPLQWLNVGSGAVGSGLRPPDISAPDWTEIRLDADPRVSPDILAPANDLLQVADATMDAAFSSHCIEHLYLDQAVPALSEWRRVLKPDGFLLLVCPDLQAAAEMITQDKLMDIAWANIRPFDIVFSHQGLVAAGRAAGNTFMEHRSGYTLSVLMQLIKLAAYPSCIGYRMRARFELWVMAFPRGCSDEEMRTRASRHFLR